MEDPAAAPQLRQDLKQASSAGTNYDVAAGLSALRATISQAGTGQESGASASDSPSLAPEASAPASAAVGWSLGTKLAVTTLGLLVATGMMFGVLSKSASPEPQLSSDPAGNPPATTVEPADHIATPADTAPSLSADKPVPSTANNSPSMVRESKVPSAASHRAVSRKPAISADEGHEQGPDLRREIAELARIKSLLPRDPARAYDLAIAGHARFGRGMLYPEREALAVLALSALGRDAEAKRRGQSFIQSYPDSPLRTRIQAAISGSQDMEEAKP